MLESFGVVHDQNGRQVEYEGHPLYTSDQDTGPDQANGEGFEDAWYVATIDLAPGSW
jgi:predicted lipoprotein with Yx(FWY)xxD motif